VAGTVQNNNTTAGFTTTGTLTFASGGLYQHKAVAGAVPTATWSSGSTFGYVGITGTGTTFPTGLNQTFHHFKWSDVGTGVKNTNQNLTVDGDMTIATAGTWTWATTANRTIAITGSYSLNSGTNNWATTAAHTVTVGGNFTVAGGTLSQMTTTGAPTLVVTGDIVLSSGTLTMSTGNAANASISSRDLTISGATLNMMTGGNTNSRATITVTRDFSVSSGTFNMTNVGFANAVGTMNVAGNFSHTAGTITETGSSSGSIIFNGTATQTYTSGGTVSNTINYTVNESAILQMAAESTTVAGAGTFVLSSGATLGITSANGITTVGTASGNIRTTTARTFNVGAKYIYNRSAGGAQGTGTGLPTGLNAPLSPQIALQIDNPGGTVTLSQAQAIATGGVKVDLKNGTFAAGTNLTLSSNAAITRSGGDMTGTPQGAGTYNVTYTGNSKTTGTELAGTGRTNVTVNLTAGQTLTLDTARSMINLSSLNLTSGTFAAGTNLTMSSTSYIYIADGGMTGTLQGSGTYNVQYDPGASKTTGSELSGSGINNIQVQLSNTLTLGANISIAGTITVLGGNTLDTNNSNNYNITAASISLSDTAGTLNARASVITLTGTSGTLFSRSSTAVFTQGTSEVKVTSSSGTPTLLSNATTFHRLTIDHASANITAGAVITMSSADANNRLYIKQGILSDGGNTIIGTANGTMVMDAGTTFKIGNGTASTFPTNYTNGIISLQQTSTVIYNSTSAQTISSVPTYGRLQLSADSGTPTKSLNGSTTVNGNLTIDASNILDTVSGQNHSLSLKGNYTNNGTFTARSGTVTLSGTTTQTIFSDNTWFNLEAVTSSARSIVFEAGKTQTIASGGSVTFTGLSGQLLTLASSLTNSTKWNLAIPAGSSRTVDYVSAVDAAATDDAITPTNSTCTRTTNWSCGGGGGGGETVPSRGLRLFEGFLMKFFDGKVILHQTQP